jgi:Peptidase family S41
MAANPPDLCPSPVKTALYGIDAIALLRGLRRRAAVMTDEEFHREMRRIVAEIRDRHTYYSYAGFGPNYWLRFLVERAFDGDKPVYIVTKSYAPEVARGSTVVRWNDTPIEAVMRELAEDIGAGNEASRHALARLFLTWRLASQVDPPDEDEVRLDLRGPDGTAIEVRMDWSRVQPQATRRLGASKLLGVDMDLLNSRRWMFETFNPQKFKELSAEPYPNVEARAIRYGDTDFGYLRVFDFWVDDANDFANYVAARLRGLPTSGVVIDLRGNPGGYIRAGEKLLQLFTSQRIQPLGFRIRASDATRYLCGEGDAYSPLAATVNQGARLGAEYSATVPITAANAIGRVYPGPSILIVDALTFSTADMFTAGYKDHAIGAVICTDENIGARRCEQLGIRGTAGQVSRLRHANRS